jgi:predicted AAA+ superfamily ATPase
MDITLYLLSNIGKETTFNSLKKTFEVGSANSVSDYLKWLEDCYLLFFLNKFSWSAKSIAINPRKVYGIDTALVQSNSLSFTKDKGRLFENAVFLFLRRKNLDLFYFRENKECDFVVFEKGKCKMLVQVCEEIHSDNQDREVNGLLEAMNYFGLSTGYIVTKSQDDYLEFDDKKVVFLPINQWMKIQF